MKSILASFLLAFALLFSISIANADNSLPGGDKSASFTLHNKTLKSIPLIIPGVMNPNLSPMSNSAVDLALGQKILFKYKGKKQVLLIVSKDLEGQTLDVAGLLKERKKALGIEDEAEETE
ncbi:MAG: hypothetical protein H6581_10320 [Bacteroidia bacterium]|nr:hypothetical protein [Bacteroidia bacterium]